MYITYLHSRGGLGTYIIREINFIFISVEQIIFFSSPHDHFHNCLQLLNFANYPQI